MLGGEYIVNSTIEVVGVNINNYESICAHMGSRIRLVSESARHLARLYKSSAITATSKTKCVIRRDNVQVHLARRGRSMVQHTIGPVGNRAKS